MTFSEHRRRQKEYERMKWDALSLEEQEKAWERRQLYLWTKFLSLDRKWVNLIVGCPGCEPSTRIATDHWPNHFECVCGVVVIFDRWLPDGVERVTMMTPDALDYFSVAGPRLFDLFNYPLEERLRDLDGASAFPEAAI